ncbi:MAG: UDP-N-acetylmuramate--L-alanine ligase [Lentimicrobium sp.]|nr:UDP-N-acetylmuramate--L-alanine ligase [Lentimicrobium sp.]
MNTETLKSVYFLGIGGIGMSALARYFHAAGIEVSGYDKTHTVLTAQLEAEGMHIHFEDRPELIPENADLIVYTPAVPKDLAEYIKATSGRFLAKKRAEVLGELTDSKKLIAVAGTHGKTTVSSMIAHTLFKSSIGCTAFLGGILKNCNTNLLLNPESPVMVTEADEFDRSFLKLSPWLAVITSADADHLDIYADHQDLKIAFMQFAAKVKEGGVLLIKKDIGLDLTSVSDIEVYTYALNQQADFYAENLRIENYTYHFDLVIPEGRIKGMSPGLGGLFNVENSIACAAAAWLSGATADEIKTGIQTFSGVRRRFDIRISRPGFLYIDDYAHHPQELSACINSVRKLHPGRHITGIFQPHLYSRTRDFADDFSASLSLLDRVILLDIYPAREVPIEGITSDMLLEKITSPEKSVCSRQEVMRQVAENQPDILLTLGAGDIDQMVLPLEALFTQKQGL